MVPDGVECCLGQRMVLLRVNPEICDNYYLLYSLQSRYVQHQISWSEGTGTTVSNLRIPHLEQLKIPYIDFTKQRAVSSVLRAIEQKISHNRKINDNLQQQVQAVFSDWLSKHIEDSDEVSLGEICAKVTDGSHFSPKDDPTATIPMLSVKDMGEFDFNLTSCKHISETDYQKMLVNDCVPQINDILVAKDGSYLKEIFISNENRQLAILSSIAIFRPDTSKIYPEILLAF